MREKERVSKTDRHKRDCMHHRHRETDAKRDAERQKDTSCLRHKTKKRAYKRQKIKLIRRDGQAWRNVVIQTETGCTGDRKLQRAGESKTKLQKSP